MRPSSSRPAFGGADPSRVVWFGLGAIALSAVLGLGAMAAMAPGLSAELLTYGPDLRILARQHFLLVGISTALAALAGFPLGILLSRRRFARHAELVMQVLNIGATVPSLAVLALAMSVLGLGLAPALLALWLATLLPIVRNTYAGLVGVSPSLLDAADGMGMGSATRLRRVELPSALPILFAGLRTGVTVNIGTAPLASLIGAGGFGDLIFAGIQLYEPAMMLAGALATAGLALAADLLLAGLQHLTTRRPHAGRREGLRRQEKRPSWDPGSGGA